MLGQVDPNTLAGLEAGIEGRQRFVNLGGLVVAREAAIGFYQFGVIGLVPDPL